MNNSNYMYIIIRYLKLLFKYFLYQLTNYKKISLNYILINVFNSMNSRYNNMDTDCSNGEINDIEDLYSL